jgi:hypothetical protein
MKGFEREIAFARSNERILTIVHRKNRATRIASSRVALKKKSAHSAPSFGEISPYFVLKDSIDRFRFLV